MLRNADHSFRQPTDCKTLRLVACNTPRHLIPADFVRRLPFQWGHIHSALWSLRCTKTYRIFPPNEEYTARPNAHPRDPAAQTAAPKPAQGLQSVTALTHIGLSKMPPENSICWTNPSVLAFAPDEDPVQKVQRVARALVLEAREQGWEGPPFNPIELANYLGIRTAANSDVPDARLVNAEAGATIEYNPRQIRERVRFSIAHEVAHHLFSDWRERTRNRGAENSQPDDWQLEMLCNLAASEFVLPVGSLQSSEAVGPIEQLVQSARRFDVSIEAYLIRLAKICAVPIIALFASPYLTGDHNRRYRVDYSISSPTAPRARLAGRVVPVSSVMSNCTALGYTDKARENWILDRPHTAEYVGIGAYPGSRYPRVAGLVRLEDSESTQPAIRFVYGDIRTPLRGGSRIVCQMVNDKATTWGGGVARKMAQVFPHAQQEYKRKLAAMPVEDRLGSVIFCHGEQELVVASLIAQRGFGPSKAPRIRYLALENCLAELARYAVRQQASIHMPRIGTGAAGGDWGTIEEMIDEFLVRQGLSVSIYDPPPKRRQLELFG